jgi:uncharacterized protein (DUF2062 family)
VRFVLWPRCGWRRSVRYTALRLTRLDATPHAIGLGVAVGVFASFQPVLGFQMLLAGAMAWLLRASLGAALIGTFVGGPLTYPFMWLASYHAGAVLTGASHSITIGALWSAIMDLGALASVDPADVSTAGSLAWQVFYPLAVGAVPVGMMAGIAFYVIVLRAWRLCAR